MYWIGSHATYIPRLFPKENVLSDEISHHEQIIEKFVWDNLSAQTFTSLMCTDETCAIPDEATSLIDFDIDKALDIFNNCIKEKAECIKKQMLPPTFWQQFAILPS